MQDFGTSMPTNGGLIAEDAFESTKDNPLHISDFECVSSTLNTVVIVFRPTKRTYLFSWGNKDIIFAEPKITGSCGLNDYHVIDCLARAVAYKASKMPALSQNHLRKKKPFSRMLMHRLQGRICKW